MLLKSNLTEIMSITLIIIIITCLISFYAWNKPQILEKWMMNPYAIHTRKEYYRFLTSGFIHRDYMHLIFNMLTLYFFGSVVENIYMAYISPTTGIILFITLYLLAIVISDIPTFLKNKNDNHYNSLGASGGIAAIVFASILFNPLAKICLYFAICIPGFILGFIYIIYSAYQAKQSGGYVNHQAHLYGALVGLVFNILLMPRSIIYFFQQLSTWRLFD